MNNRKQPAYKKYETSLDRKARISQQLYRRDSIEKSYINNQLDSFNEDLDNDYEDYDEYQNYTQR